MRASSSRYRKESTRMRRDDRRVIWVVSRVCGVLDISVRSSNQCSK